MSGRVTMIHDVATEASNTYVMPRDVISLLRNAGVIHPGIFLKLQEDIRNDMKDRFIEILTSVIINKR